MDAQVAASDRVCTGEEVAGVVATTRAPGSGRYQSNVLRAKLESLRPFFDLLTPESRALVELRVGGLGPNEIATRLNRSARTVRVLLSAIRRRLERFRDTSDETTLDWMRTKNKISEWCALWLGHRGDPRTSRIIRTHYMRWTPDAISASCPF